jgi:hypothetical protein
MFWRILGLVAVAALAAAVLVGCGGGGDDAALQKLDASLHQAKTLLLREDWGATSAILEARVLCRDDLAEAQAEPGGIAGQLRQACDHVGGIDLLPEGGDEAFDWGAAKSEVGDAIIHLDYYMIEREM